MEQSVYILGKSITLMVIPVGDALSFLCFGGDKPHIGSCSIAQPYPSPRGGTRAAVSTLSVPRHQEWGLSAKMAESLCKRLGVALSVQCGIHYDSASKAQIAEVVEAVLGLCESLAGDILAERNQEES